MGLLFQMPNVFEDPEHVIIHPNDNGPIESVRLRSYGLPPIFWAYGAASSSVLILLYLAAWGPLQTLITQEDLINKLLGYGTICLFGFSLLALICFYFYEKNILVTKTQMKIIHRILGIGLFSKSFSHPNGKFEINNFVDSPNMARIKDEKALKNFQNKGYFELIWTSLGNSGSEDKRILVDRSNRKKDLEKLLQFFNQLQFKA